MRTYEIWEHPSAVYKPQIIKQGYNYVAFFFPVLWCLLKRLWKEAFILFLFFYTINLLSDCLPDTTAKYLLSFILLMIGHVTALLYASDRLKIKTHNEGYIFKGSFVARNKRHALSLYIGENI